MIAIYLIDSIPYLFFIGLSAYLIIGTIAERRQRTAIVRKVGDTIIQENNRTKSRQPLPMVITSIQYVCKAPDYVKPFYITKEEADRYDQEHRPDTMI